jgi:hypothetical protein
MYLLYVCGLSVPASRRPPTPTTPSQLSTRLNHRQSDGSHAEANFKSALAALCSPAVCSPSMLPAGCSWPGPRGHPTLSVPLFFSLIFVAQFATYSALSPVSPGEACQHPKDHRIEVRRLPRLPLELLRPAAARACPLLARTSGVGTLAWQASMPAFRFSRRFALRDSNQTIVFLPAADGKVLLCRLPPGPACLPGGPSAYRGVAAARHDRTIDFQAQDRSILLPAPRRGRRQ